MARRASSIFSSRLRRAAAAGAVTAAFFLAVVAAKFFFSYRLAPTTAGLGGLARGADLDYLFIGSSHTRQGYLPELIEAATGKSVYVLSYNGLDAVFIRELLVHLLDERHLRVRHVVIEAYCLNAVSESALRDYRLFNDSPPRLKMRLLDVLRRLGRLSWKSGYELLVLGGNEQLLTAPVLNPLVVNPSSRHGGYSGKNAPGLTADEFTRLERYVPADLGSGIRPIQREAWEGLFALVREHGVAVDFVEVPMPAPITTLPVIADARRELMALLASHGFNYVDLSEQGLLDARDPALFTDWNHLSSAGRDAYSRAFAAWLEREPRTR